MKLAVIAITGNGLRIAREIEEKEKDNIDIYVAEKLAEKTTDKSNLKFYSGRLKELVADIFTEYDGLVFIMALGIVVRIISEFAIDKRYDPAVVTIDETKQFVISTLSGHLGGANELTSRLAKLLNTTPVITTATDCQGKLAIDMLAKKLDCKIEPFTNLKRVNAAIVNGEQVNIFTDYDLDLELRADNLAMYSLTAVEERASKANVIISNSQLELPEEIKSGPYLWLKPRNLIIGVGCRRGISKERITAAIKTGLDKINKDLSQVKALATIELKAEEKGLIEYAREKNLDLNIISRQQIKESNLEFTTSEFVKKAIGVGGVCEPAALLSGKKMELLLEKTKLQGVTVAIAEERFM